MRKADAPIERNPKHSKFDSKGLDDYDFELLRRLVNSKLNNEVIPVVNNKQYYSKNTLDSYEMMHRSLVKLSNAIKLQQNVIYINEIPTSW